MLGLFGFTQLPLNTPAYPNTLVHQGESTVKMAAALQAGTPAPPTPAARTLKQPERKTAHSAPGSPALCAAFPSRDGGTANRSAASPRPPRSPFRPPRGRVARRRAGGRHVEGEGVACGASRGEGVLHLGEPCGCRLSSGLHVTLGYPPRAPSLPLEGRSSQAGPPRDVNAAAVQRGKGQGGRPACSYVEGGRGAGSNPVFFRSLWLWRVEFIRLSFIFSHVPVWKIRVGKLRFREHRGDWQLYPDTRSKVSTTVRAEATHRRQWAAPRVWWRWWMMPCARLCSQDPGV